MEKVSERRNASFQKRDLTSGVQNHTSSRKQFKLLVVTPNIQSYKSWLFIIRTPNSDYRSYSLLIDKSARTKSIVVVSWKYQYHALLWSKFLPVILSYHDAQINLLLARLLLLVRWSTSRRSSTSTAKNSDTTLSILYFNLSNHVALAPLVPLFI